MPGAVLNRVAVMTCPHGGTVSAVPTPSRVLVAGAPVLTFSDQLIVKACGFNVPCVKAQWTNVSPRVTTSTGFVLLQAPPSGPGNGLIAPNVVPPTVIAVQPRVIGS